MVRLFVGLGSIALLGVCLSILLMRAVGHPRAFVRSLSLIGLARTVLSAIVTTGAVLLSMALSWVAFGIRPHRLDTARGELGAYGVVHDDRFMAEGVTVVRFNAVYVPSRVISVLGIPWPVPESVEVEVVYRRGTGSQKTWEHTYLISCEEDKGCVPLYQLTGIQLCAETDNLRSTPACGPFVFLRGQILPSLSGRPPLRPSEPPTLPQRPQKPKKDELGGAPKSLIASAPPRLFIRAGRFLFYAW
ncbi:MAG: hypothetical protein IT405_01110 [Candidatus Yanofskybacteria bacterium]|nr:hypothetical protein [Candidatus Yanofskybacteria bacterium]